MPPQNDHVAQLKLAELLGEMERTPASMERHEMTNDTIIGMQFRKKEELWRRITFKQFNMPILFSPKCEKSLLKNWMVLST